MKTLTDSVQESFNNQVNENNSKQYTSKTSNGKVTGWMTVGLGKDSLGEPVVGIAILGSNKTYAGLKKTEVEELIKDLQQLSKKL